MSVFGFEDSFHITEPLLEGTPLTAWVAAPIYAVGYAAILLIMPDRNGTNQFWNGQKTSLQR